MENTKMALLNLNETEMTDYILSLGMKKFYGKQIYNWLHSKLARNIHDMTNISLKDRETLSEKAYIPLLNIVNHQISKIDGTEKFLFKLEDGNTIETVIFLLEIFKPFSSERIFIAFIKLSIFKKGSPIPINTRLFTDCSLFLSLLSIV